MSVSKQTNTMSDEENMITIKMSQKDYDRFIYLIERDNKKREYQRKYMRKYNKEKNKSGIKRNVSKRVNNVNFIVVSK